MRPVREGPPRFMRPARLALASLLLSLTVAARMVEANQTAVVTSADGLHLREGPGTSQRSLMVIPNGARVAVVSAANEEGWYPIMHNGRRGWASGAYLSLDGGGERRATINSPEGLNVRAAPSVRADVVTVLPSGSVQTVSAPTSDGWAWVQGDHPGWVNTAYLNFESGGNAPLQIAAPAASSGASGFAALSAPSAPSTATQRITIRYYAAFFEGGPMYCGGIYRGEDPTVIATNSWPCGTVLKVCYSGQCITGTVRDRGAMEAGAIDLSPAGFSRLSPLATGVLGGTAEVVSTP